MINSIEIEILTFGQDFRHHIMPQGHPIVQLPVLKEMVTGQPLGFLLGRVKLV